MAEAEITSSPTKEETTELEEGKKPRSSTPDFTKPWPGSDITFVIEDRKIYANKLILSMWSPVMEAMFTSDFKEKDAAEITLPGKVYADFLELLRVTHPPNKEVTGSNISKLLSLGLEYQMSILLDHCERYLLKEPLSIHSLIVAEYCGLRKLRAACIQYAKDTSLSELQKQAEFESVNPTTLNEILIDKVMRFEPKHDHLKPCMQSIRLKLDEKNVNSQECSRPHPSVHVLGEYGGCLRGEKFKSALADNKGKKEKGKVLCECMLTRHFLGQIDSCQTCRSANWSEIFQVVKRFNGMNSNW